MALLETNGTRRRRLSRGLAVVACSALVAAGLGSCSVDIDLSEKTCPCPSGLLCDQSTNRCVTTLPITPGADGRSPPPAACTEAACACAVDGDCKDPKRRFCGPDKTCVECLPTPTDTCTAGGYCNSAHQCAVGCKTETDCPDGQQCMTMLHRCAACATDAECGEAGAAKKCSPSGSCVEACPTNGAPCGTGGVCCAGFCLSLVDDVLNCGQCGNVCSVSNGSPTCTDGSCTWKCVDGYDHCTGPLDNTGCETSIRTPSNCGRCGASCTSAQVLFANGIACAGTACTYSTCSQGHVDLDKNPANGCEAPCGAKNEICCPSGSACNSGNDCRSNGTCPPN